MNRMEEIIRQRKAEDDAPLCAHLYDLDHLASHVKRITQSLPSRIGMFYAMKANSERPVLETIAPLAAGFEVASLGEVEKARAVSRDIPVIFGGPGKTDQELEGGIRLGVTRFHVESLQELLRLERIAARLNVHVPILLRINLKGPFPSATLQMAGRPTQFGIDEDEVAVAIQLAQQSSHLKLEGFHFHSLSNNLDPERHLALLTMYRDKVMAWEEALGIQVTTLNVGGGIGVNYADLSAQFDWEAFTRGLEGLLDTFPAHWRNLMFECGRFLTASCGGYGVEVLDIKKNHGQWYVIVRGGTHHFRLPVSWQHSHPFDVVEIDHWDYPFPRKETGGEPVTVTGQLCTPKDVLARDVILPRVRIGDVLLFRFTGAYGWSISHHDFLSHPHPDQLYLKQGQPVLTGV
ncbi:type III PLP-dependent enzyme [Salinithrix halophila]|uniref:Type III PLP-dependent enzyme n=1 Tax=Salinithrix halophila TaxID=1485204 RepID=A0ABV8JI58_9BACL